MYYDTKESAIEANPSATHIMTTSDQWLEHLRNPHLNGKFIAVHDTGENYRVIHNLDNRIRNVKYDSDWVVAEALHHG